MRSLCPTIEVSPDIPISGDSGVCGGIPAHTPENEPGDIVLVRFPTRIMAVLSVGDFQAVHSMQYTIISRLGFRPACEVLTVFRQQVHPQ